MKTGFLGGDELARVMFNSVPTQGVFAGPGGQFMGGSPPQRPGFGSLQQPVLSGQNYMSPDMSMLQQPSTGARITPIAGMSTPQFMGATPMQVQVSMRVLVFVCVYLFACVERAHRCLSCHSCVSTHVDPAGGIAVRCNELKCTCGCENSNRRRYSSSQDRRRSKNWLC